MSYASVESISSARRQDAAMLLATATRLRQLEVDDLASAEARDRRADEMEAEARREFAVVKRMIGVPMERAA